MHSFHVRDQSRREFDEGVGVGERHQQAVLVVAHVLACRGIVVSNRGQAAGHRLDGHVAVGLGQAGVKEDVAGSVVLCQRFARQHPGEDHMRVLLLQFGAGGAVADHHQTRQRIDLAHLLERLDDHMQVLFGRDTADQHHHRYVFVSVP